MTEVEATFDPTRSSTWTMDLGGAHRPDFHRSVVHHWQVLLFETRPSSNQTIDKQNETATRLRTEQPHALGHCYGNSSTGIRSHLAKISKTNALTDDQGRTAEK